VYLGAGVRVEGGAMLEPYTGLYDGCTVGARAVVGDAILWPGCDVGQGGVVRGAILGLDVAVEPNAAVPAGAVLGRGERVTAAR
jgi:NDP-sugar pyrophosphorylase family protein